MIRYKNWGLDYFLSALRTRVSVFPVACAAALPCAVLAALLRVAIDRGLVPDFTDGGEFMKESQAWTGFTALLGFLIVFRTHQSHNRFWEASGTIYAMQAHVVDAASTLMSFTTNSRAPVNEILQFKHTMARLLSMMHACAMGSLYGSGIEDDPLATFSFEMIDPSKLDKASRAKVKAATFRMELVFSWVLNAITRAHEAGVLCVPPPVLSRVYQSLSNSMTAYQDATRISDTPFPLPYAHTCDLLMGLDWAISPFAFSYFSLSPIWAGIFCFMHVFVLWALNMTAVEIETPFGMDAHDLDLHSLQKLLNGKLSQLLSEDVLTEPIARTVSVNEQCLPTSTRVCFIEAEQRTTRRFPSLTPTSAPEVSKIFKRLPSDGAKPVGEAPSTPRTVERRQMLGHGEMLDANSRWEVFDVDGSSGPSRNASKESRRPGASQDGGANQEFDDTELDFSRYISDDHELDAGELVLTGDDLHGDKLPWSQRPTPPAIDGDPGGYPRSGGTVCYTPPGTRVSSSHSRVRYYAEDEVPCAEGTVLPEGCDPDAAGWRAAGGCLVEDEADGARRAGRAYLESRYLNEAGAPACYVEPTFIEGAGCAHPAMPATRRASSTATEILV